MSSGSLLGVSVLELRTDQRPLNTGLASAERKVDASGARMQASVDKRMTMAGRSMSRAGTTLSRNLTVPIVALAAGAADLEVKFQSAMEMIHTQAGASQREVDNLRGKVLALAKVLPQSPQQLAQGLFHLESIGLRGAKAMDALKLAAQGAAVGNANLEDVATALGSAWLVNIKGAGNLKDVMALLNATVGAGNMRFQQLTDALGTGVLPTAKEAGLSIKDVMGALAVFTDEGYQASSAAAQFSTALHFLTNPTAKADTALKSMGMSATAMAQDMHKPNGLLLALKDLKSHLDKLPGGSGGIKAEQVLGNILPGGRGRIMLTLINQLDRYQMKLSQIQRTTKGFNDAVTKTQQTDSYKIHTAWSTIQADAIQFGHKILPELLGAADTVVKDVDKVATAFSKLSPGAQHAILTGGLLLAGIGPAMKLLGVFTGGVGRLLTLADKLGGIGGVGASALARGSTAVGTMEVGTLIAKNMISGPGTHGPTAPEAAAAGAGGAEVATGAFGALGLRKTLGIGGAAAAGIGGFAAASHAQGGIGNQLNAFAHGIDPTSVLHLVGLPAVSDLLPTVKKRMNLSPTEIAAIGMGFDPASFKRVASGGRGAFGGSGLPIATTAIAHGGVVPASAHRSLTMFALDAQRAQAEVDHLGKDSSKAFRQMAVSAAVVNDVKFTFGDTLASELLKGKRVSSRGVQNIIHEIDKLPPAAQADAAQGMIEMTRQLESKGAVAQGTTKKLRQSIVAEFQLMAQGVGTQADAMASKIQHGSSTSASKAARNFANLQTAIGLAMQSGVVSTQQGASMIHDALNATLKAFGSKNLVPAVVGITKAQIGNSVLTATGQILGAVGIGGHATGGKVSRPTYMVGEEGPQHHEWVIATNPAYRRSNLNYWARAGHDLGIPGFAQGGGVGPTAGAVNQTSMGSGPVVLDPGVNMSVGQEPQILQDLHRLAVELGNVVYVISGYRSPSHSVAVGGFPNDPHTRGQAADIGVGSPSLASMFGVSEAQLRAVGLYRPFYPADPHEVNHVQLAAGGSGFGGIGGAIAGLASVVWNALKAPKVEGGGTVPDMVRLALGKATSAANAYGQKQAGLAGASGGGNFGAGSPAQAKAWTAQAMALAGVSGSLWDNMLLRQESRESSYNPGSVNRTDINAQRGDPSEGIMQITGSNFAQYHLPGHGAIFNPVDNIAAAIRYIIATYGGGNAGTAAQVMWNRGGGAYARGGWVRTGATVDPTRGQYPTYSDHGGWSFAELLEAGANAGRRPDLTQLLGLKRGSYGMPMETPIMVRNPGGSKAFKIFKNDVGSGQSSPFYTTDLHPSIARALGHDPSTFKGAIEVARVGTPTSTAAHGKRKNPGDRWNPLSQTWNPAPAGSRKLDIPTPPDTRGGRAGGNAIARGIGQLNALLGDRGEIAKLEDLYTGTDAIFQARHPNLQYVVTQDALGNSITPYLDQKTIALATGELMKLHGWEAKIIADYRKAQRLIRALIKRLRREVEKRRRQIRAIKQHIRRNLRLMSAANRALHHTKDKATQKRLKDNIGSLRDENQKLGGDRDHVGTGGQLGTLGNQLSSMQGSLGNVLQSQLDVEGPSGHGGSLNDARVTMIGLNQQLGAVSPKALAQALATAKAQGGSSNNSELATLLEEQNQQLAQQLAVSQAQYGVLSSLPPFGGSFATGGMVPGPRGAPRLIVAHGEEEIIPVGGGDGAQVKVRIEDQRVRVWVNDVEQIVDRRMRTVSRNAAAGLPGRGGGGLFTR